MTPRRRSGIALRRAAFAGGIIVLAAALVVGYIGRHDIMNGAKAIAGRIAPVTIPTSAPAPTPTEPNTTPLLDALRLHRPVVVAGIGSSVGDGATLPDPATQSPVAHLGALLHTHFPRSRVTVHNLSVAGSTAFDGVSVYMTEVRPIHPTVLLITFGMNDGQTAEFNSGETLTGSMSALNSIVATARLDGTTVLLATTPSPDTERNSVDLPTGLPIQYPVPGGKLVPSIADSVTTIDGEPFSTRHALWNAAARKLTKADGAILVDAASYWPAAVRRYGQSGLFDPGHGADDPPQFVHPNLLGHRLSFWKAEAQVISTLAREVGPQ